MGRLMLGGRVLLSVTAACALVACGGKSADEDDGDGTSGSGSNAAAGTDAAGSGSAGEGAAGTGSETEGTAGMAGSDSSNGGTGGSAGNSGGTAGEGKKVEITPPPEEVLEMLDPDTDWEALTLVYPTMYSAWDGEHTFQVPIHIQDTTIDLSGWEAIPADSVLIEEDPDVEGGVMVTVLEPEEQITIAASEEGIGGTAALFITKGTPEQWQAGADRYANGIEFELDFMVDFAQILDPNWEPPAPPPDLACNNCHTTGAKYFEIQHTPTQAAYYSDEDLRKILKEGMKPEGVGFRILPDMLGSQTAEEIYGMYHRWDTTDEEVTGLIIYLRSLTPTGQGDILLPDGTYVPPGTMPPGFMNP